MPTYDYVCDSCGKVFEVAHGMKEEGPSECGCGSKGTVHRLMSAGSGLIFKGSGFYITDYNKKSSSASSSATESKTESKPAGGCGSGCACHS